MRGRALGPVAPALALGFIFLSGAGLGSLSLLLPHDDRATESVAYVLAGLAMVGGVALLRRPELFAAESRLHAMTLLGTVILTAGVAAGGPSVYGVMFLWTGVYACVFFSGPLAAAHVAACGAGYAVALTVAGFADDTPVGRWVVTMGALVIIGYVARWLMDHLRRAESRMREVLETAQDGHLIVGADGVVVEVNAALAAIVGRSRDELVGALLVDLLVPERRAAHAERRASVFASREPVRFDSEFVGADGAPVPVHVSATPIEIEGERFIAAFLHPLRERRIAEALQRSLLPETLPSLAGVQIAARYQPAAREADVGGDFYDAVVLRDDRLALAMGDVAGKGLRGAAMVGRVRSALRAYLLEHDDPAAVASRLNAVVAAEPSEIELITLVLLVLDPSTGAVTWVNCGHPPPLVVPAGGAPSWLEGRVGPPLGTVSAPGYVADTHRIPVGAALVLYTDGLVERPAATLDGGLARMAREARAATGDVEALVDALVAGGEADGGGHDDVAVLAVRAQPLGPRLELDLPARADSLAEMRATMRRWLGEQDGVGESEAARLLLAIDEACTNAVEHARGEQAQRYRLLAVAGRDEIRVEVQSAGAWRTPRPGRIDGGRGLGLMRALVDAVDVRPTDDGTIVRLTRKV